MANTLMFEVAIADVKAKLDEQKKAIEHWVDGNPIKLRVSLDGIKDQLNAMGAVFGSNNPVIEKLKQETGSLEKELKKVGDASKSAAKEQESSIDNLSIKYATLIQRIENWQGSLSKLLSSGGHSNYFDSQLRSAISSYQYLKERVASSGGSKEELDQLRAAMTLLGQTYANVNKEAKSFNKEQEKLANEANKTAQKIAQLSSPSTKVNLVSEQNTQEIRNQIDAIGALYMRIKELQGIKVDSPKSWDQLLFGGNWKRYEGTYQEQMEVFRSTFQRVQKELYDMQSRGLDVSGYQKQLNSLYETYEKFAALQPIDLAKKLGIEHLRGYTGPSSAADELTWATMKKQAEIQEVAGQAAERHRRKLEELTNAFAAHDAQVAKSNRLQANYNQSRQETTASLRQQSEALVKSRLDVLRGQEEQLRKLLSNGREGLGAEQYDAVRNALRGVREEMRQIETVMQRMESYSTRNLFSVGRGGMDYTPTIQHANQVLKENEEKKRQDAASTSQLTAEEQRLASAIGHSTGEMRGQSQVLSDLKSMAMQYVSVWGASNLLDNIIKIGGQLEQQRLSIGAILGDMAAGQHLFDQIKSLALVSPFGVMELDKDTKQLAAYGFKQSELFDMTKRLADISAGAGTEVSRLALALGHVRSEGALSGYTLRQFAMNNIPMLGKLSERLTEIEGKIVSTQEIRKRISKKEIGYEDVIAVIKDLTNEGGMFYNMQETMSEAVNAKFKNLHDSLDIMYSEIAESKVGDALKAIAETLMVLSRNWESTTRFLSYGAMAWLAYKTAVMGANMGLTKFGVEEARSTMMLNAKKIALNLNSASVRRLTADEVDEMVTLKLLTREQLLNAVASGKLTVAQAELAAATFNVSGAQLASLASMGKTGVMATGLGMKIRSLALSIRGIGVALKTAFLNPITIAITAVTALFEWYMRWKQHNDEIKESISNLEKKSSEGYRNLSDTLNKFSKVGKMDETGYVSAINDIIDALKNYAPDINNILKQAYSIDDLGKRYEYLRDELEKTKNAYANLERVAGTAVYAAENSDLPDEIEDYIDALKKQTKAEHEFYQNRAAIEKALDRLGKYEGFNKARRNDDGSLKMISEQIALIRGNGGWSKMFSAYIYQESLRAAEAWNTFNGKLSESEQIMTNNLEPAIKDFADRINNDYIGKFGKDWKKDSANIKTAWMEIKDEIDKVPGMTDNVRNELLDKIFNQRWKLNIDFNTGEVAESLVGWRKEMQDYFDEKGILLKVGINDKVEDIEKRLKGIKDDAQAQADRYGKVLIGIGFKLDSLPSNLPSPLTTPWNQNALESYPVQKEIADKATEAAKHFNLDISGKNKNKKTGSGSHEDKDAKELRERMRILKEAADAYKYWKKAVGESGAEAHVNEEFGDVMAKLGYTFKDIKQFRETIMNEVKKYEDIYNKSGKKRPQLLEAIKEGYKTDASLNRNEFEETAEEFASKVQIELDSLTRAWEVFNNVREATGNVDLAIQISGVDYSNGKNRNLADALKEKIQKDFDAAGGGIAFDINLSDDDIDKKIKAAIPAASEERIKGLVEEYKKWRDLQRDVLKSDIDSFAKLVGGVKDYDSQLRLINIKLEKQIEANNQLAKNGAISQADANNANEIARVQATEKAWKATNSYASLFNNSLSMTRDELQNGVNIAAAILEEKMRLNLITVQEYSDEMEKLRKIMRDFDSNGLFGKDNGFTSFLKGGLSGLSEYYTRMQQRYERMAEEAKDRGDGQGWANAMNKSEDYRQAQLKLENFQNSLATATLAVDIVSGAFDGMQKATQSLSDMFDALGNEDAANTWSDIADTIGALGSTLNGASGVLKNLMSGNIGGTISSAIAAPFETITSPITAFAQLHDKKRERQIENLRRDVQQIDNTLNLIKSLRERTLGYDNGNTRRQLAQYYQNQKSSVNILWGKVDLNPTASTMYEYYSRGGLNGTGYKQELESLKKQREEYQKMYEAEDDKKKSSKEALEEYKQKMAELDLTIVNYVEDLANELWGIDFQSWADQISDALWTAFENGEDAVKAFRDTAKDIIADVAKKMMNLHFIEPAFEQLEDALFGKINTNTGLREGGVAFNSQGELDEDATLKVLGEYLGEGGYMEKQIEGAQKFYELAQKVSGIDFSSDDTKSSTGSSIKGITEQTADLLASYLNAIRADVSVDRAMISQYFPMFYQAMTGGNASLRNIENHTAAIMRSNEAIAGKVDSLESIMRRVTQGGDKIRVS